MKNTILLFAALLMTNTAFAVSALHKKHACTSCHADDKKLIGPSYQDVATRFAKDWKAKDGTTVKPADAPTYLVDKIRKGGGGNWGILPMPSNVSATDAELSAMVAAILATNTTGTKAAK
jgi:cytochrome c